MKKADRKHTFNEEEILASEIQYIELYTSNAGKIRPLLFLFKFYKGHYGQLFLSAFFTLIKMIPTWLLPLITARVINIIVSPTADSPREMAICLAIAL